MPEKSPPAEPQDLLAEFKELEDQQSEALDRPIDAGMTAIEAQEYERRAQRINEIQGALEPKPHAA